MQGKDRGKVGCGNKDDTPNGLRNDFEAAVALILPTEPVPKKRKEKRSVAEIYTTAADENKTGGGNFPRKTNMTQGGKQGGNLNSGVRKCFVLLCYHKPAV